MISYCIISYHIISNRIILYHIISYHILSYHTTSNHVISYHKIIYYGIIFLFCDTGTHRTPASSCAIDFNTGDVTHLCITEEHTTTFKIKSNPFIYCSNLMGTHTLLILHINYFGIPSHCVSIVF